MKLIIFNIIYMIMFSQIFARDYYQENGSCEISVTEQDMFNGERDLPFSLKYNYILSFESSSGEYQGYKGKISALVNSTTPVSTAEIDDIRNSFVIAKTENQGLEFNFNMNSKQIRTLLEYSGAYRIYPNDYEFPEINTTVQLIDLKRLQTHLDTNDDFGLSYHIYIECNFVGDPTQKQLKI